MKKIVLLTFIAVVLLCIIPAMAVDTGSIRVITDPPGAQIWIDGILQDHLSPFTFDGIPVGNHDVNVYLDGYIGDWSVPGAGVISGKITDAPFMLTKYEKPSIKIRSMTMKDIFEKPGDYIIFWVNLIPEPPEGKDTYWSELLVNWDNRFLNLWYSTIFCINQGGNEEPYDGGWRCEEPVNGAFVFRVVDSTPLRTLTTVNFKALFNLMNWNADDWGRQNVEKSTSVYIPEYPSPYIPATMIIGFLGAVLLIQRTRKH